MDWIKFILWIILMPIWMPILLVRLAWDITEEIYKHDKEIDNGR